MSRSYPKHYRPPPRNAQGHQYAPRGPAKGKLRLRQGDLIQIAEAMVSAAHARAAAADPSRRSDGSEHEWLELGDYYENLAREARGLDPLPDRVSFVAF